MDSFRAIEFVVEALEAFECKSVVAESKKEDTLDITESPFAYRIVADVKDHLILDEKFFNPVVKKDEYMR
jgi:hypothetical protein